MDAVKDIPFNQFFSYQDSIDNMIYGFDIMSLHNLIEKHEDNDDNNYNHRNNRQHTKYDNEILNPYTRTPLSKRVKKDFHSLLFFAKLLNEELQLTINEEEENKVVQPTTNGYNIEHRAFNLFHDIDILGNYTNPLWFMELVRHQLLVYVRNFYDIWTYRAQLSEQIKQEICPQGNPFSILQIGELPHLTLRELQNTVLLLMETMVRSGINQNSRYLGSTYVLCALTLVNDQAADALPWLYESVQF